MDAEFVGTDEKQDFTGLGTVGNVRGRTLQRLATPPKHRLSAPKGARRRWVGKRPPRRDEQLVPDEFVGYQDDARLEQVLDGRRSRTQSFFSSAAGRWDRLRSELFGSRLDAWAIAAALNRSAIVGDLGCGTGTISQTLAPWVHRVIAVDASAAMIQSARKRLKDVENVEILKGELTTLPIDDRTLDIAMMGLVLPYLAEPERVFREAARASRVDGRLIVLDMLAHDRVEYREDLGHMWLGFSETQITDWMASAGWSLEKFVTLPLEPEVKGTPVFVATAVRTRAAVDQF